MVYRTIPERVININDLARICGLCSPGKTTRYYLCRSRSSQKDGDLCVHHDCPLGEHATLADLRRLAPDLYKEFKAKYRAEIKAGKARSIIPDDYLLVQHSEVVRAGKF